MQCPSRWSRRGGGRRVDLDEVGDLGGLLNGRVGRHGAGHDGPVILDAVQLGVDDVGAVRVARVASLTASFSVFSPGRRVKAKVQGSPISSPRKRQSPRV